MLVKEILIGLDVPPVAKVVAHAVIKGNKNPLPVWGFDFYECRVRIERAADDIAWVPMASVSHYVTEAEKPKAKRGCLCNVANCGGKNGCLHRWTGFYCPHCHHEMILVKNSGYRFCSNSDASQCDYGGYGIKDDEMLRL